MSRETLTAVPSASSSVPEAGHPFEPDETQTPDDPENQAAGSDHLPPQ